MAQIYGLKISTSSLAGSVFDTPSEDEDLPRKTLSTQELERMPSERHAFLFQHKLSPNLREFHPLPSQIPFPLNVYSENMNLFVQTVHMSTVTKMIHYLRGSDVTNLTPTNQALMFSICYAAVPSMEDDNVSPACSRGTPPVLDTKASRS